MARTRVDYHAITPSANKKDPKSGEPIEAFKNNITLGIQFQNHEAYFNDLTVKKSLGLSAEEVARAMVLDFGYAVFVVGDDREHETPFDPHASLKAAAAEKAAAEKAAKASAPKAPKAAAPA